MTIANFLHARIADDEEAARAGMSNQADEGWGSEGHTLTPHVGIIHESAQMAHVVHWDPWRVLVECEAKRRIVEDWQAGLDREDGQGRPAHLNDAALSMLLKATERWLRLLALPYADHPDYQPEWRP